MTTWSKTKRTQKTAFVGNVRLKLGFSPGRKGVYDVDIVLVGSD